MRLRHAITGEQVSALITVNHAASSYGFPVLVVNGEARGTIEAAGFELVEATDEERLAVEALVGSGTGAVWNRTVEIVAEAVA
jgi:hypothetical protein